MSGFVELTGCNAESTHEKQNHTQDRENTRGSNSPCGGKRERQKEQHRCEREEKGAQKWCRGEGMGGREHVLWVGMKGRDRGQCAGGR